MQKRENTRKKFIYNESNYSLAEAWIAIETAREIYMELFLK